MSIGIKQTLGFLWGKNEYTKELRNQHTLLEARHIEKALFIYYKAHEEK